jgi:hypothetical protein
MLDFCKNIYIFNFLKELFIFNVIKYGVQR